MEKKPPKPKRVSIAAAADTSVSVFTDNEDTNQEHEPAEEVDYTLGLPRPYRRHLELLKNLREAESQHVDPERFRFTVDGADARVLTEPDGVIALHILELLNVSIRVTSFNTSFPMFFYLLVSIGNVRRVSNVAITDNNNRVRIDSLMHFSIRVSQFRDHPANKLRIELWGFQDPEIHYIISTKDIHIYQLIREVHGINQTTMWTDGFRAAKIIYEFAFAYGTFGYGHSNQLKNTDCTIFEAVSNSLFPRIANEADEPTESCFNVRLPKKLHLMTMNSFVFEKPKESESIRGRKVEPDKLAKPRIFTAHQVEFQNGVPIHCKVNMNIHQKEFEAEFNESYGQLLCLSRRRDRLDYIRSLMDGRVEDLKESTVGALYLNLDEGVVEPIIDTELDNHLRLYPFSMPCTEYPPALTLAEDEEFLRQFPHLTRTTGWLGRLFGFSAAQKDPHFLEPDIPVEEIKKPSEPGHIPKREGWFAWLWRMIRMGLNTFYICLFPELRRHIEVPEISVTLASPPGSTTEYYVRWFEEENEDVINKARARIAQEIQQADLTGELEEMGDELLHDEINHEMAALRRHHGTGYAPPHKAAAAAHEPHKTANK